MCVAFLGLHFRSSVPRVRLLWLNDSVLLLGIRLQHLVVYEASASGFSASMTPAFFLDVQLQHLNFSLQHLVDSVILLVVHLQ